MRKNNSSKLQPDNEKPARARPGRKSTPSKKASNGKSTPTKGSRTRVTSARSSTWIETLGENPEMADFLQQAIDLNRAGRAKEAANILEQAVEKFPSHAAPWWYLGGVYDYELKQPRKALRCFRKAVEINPQTERASLGLFHCLWRQDRVDEALEEIKRFQVVTNWSCQDYLEIIAEIKEKWLDAPKTKKKAKPNR